MRISDWSSDVCSSDLLPVQRDAVAALEIDGDIFGGVGRILGVHRARLDIVGGFFPRILEHLALRRGVEEVGVGAERAFAALVLGHRNLVLLGEVDQSGDRKSTRLNSSN